MNSPTAEWVAAITETATKTRGGVVWAERVAVQWELTDKVVPDWISSESAKAIAESNSRMASMGLTGDKIAGAVIGPIVFLVFMIFGVWMLSRCSKQNRNPLGKPTLRHVMTVC